MSRQIEKRILLTTSLRPTRRMRTFCRDLMHAMPHLERINRGKLSLQGLAEEAMERGLTKVLVVDRWKGGPGRMRLYKVGGEGLIQVPPQIYIKGVKLRREFGLKRRVIVRSLAVRRYTGDDEGVRKLSEALADFLEIPFTDGNEGAAHDTEIRFSLDNSQRIRWTFFYIPWMVEVGPRITLSHAVWDI